MEVLQRELFFSKQGKTSAHNHSILFAGKKKRPKPKELNIIDPYDEEVLSKIGIRENKETKVKVVKPDSTFRAVSREKRELAFRNKTDSPMVGLYTPKYSAVDARVNQGPIFKTHSHKPRKVTLEVPNCLNAQLMCTFPKHNRCKPREILTITEVQTKIKSRKVNTKAEPAPFIRKVNFKLQTARKPFVSPQDPPSEERFLHVETSSFVLSKNKRPKTVSFSKMLSRQELIEVKQNVGPYEVNENQIRPRSGLDVLNFKLMGERKPLIIKERLVTPDSPALDVLDRAYFKQSNVRGSYKIPKISTVSPRDDSMYKTTEAYSLNLSKYLKIDSLIL